jgi:tetratricopeptide (TPR) repeat protein
LLKKKYHEDPKYGQDSATRMEVVKNISLYSEFVKQNNWKDAFKPWLFVFDNAPKASKNTYIKGAKIIKGLLTKAKGEKRTNLIDTLMLVYDRRIDNYGQKGMVYAYKANDLNGYLGDEASAKVMEWLEFHCKDRKKLAESAVITIYMQAVVREFREGNISGDKVIDAFTLSVETLDAVKKYEETKLAAGGKKAAKAKAELERNATSLTNVEALFSESGAATPEALVRIFSPQYEENKDNIDWLRKVTKLLNRADTTEADLFAKASERQYTLEPNAESAHNLARLFLKRKEFDKSEKYYAEATSLQEDAVTKAAYFYEWGTLALAQEKYSTVREHAMKALELNPKDGKPYIIIGKAYAATKGIGKEAVEAHSVYWVAVDVFAKAKSVDPEVAEEAQGLINTYSKYFPNQEEWFMAVGTGKGDSYTVGGWINKATKVRF